MIDMKELLNAIQNDPEVGQAVAIYVSVTSNASDEKSINFAEQCLIDRIKFIVSKNRKILLRDLDNYEDSVL